jgi:hypothetical protein
MAGLTAWWWDLAPVGTMSLNIVGPARSGDNAMGPGILFKLVLVAAF